MLSLTEFSLGLLVRESRMTAPTVPTPPSYF